MKLRIYNWTHNKGFYLNGHKVFVSVDEDKLFSPENLIKDHSLEPSLTMDYLEVDLPRGNYLVTVQSDIIGFKKLVKQIYSSGSRYAQKSYTILDDTAGNKTAMFLAKKDT